MSNTLKCSWRFQSCYIRQYACSTETNLMQWIFLRIFFILIVTGHEQMALGKLWELFIPIELITGYRLKYSWRFESTIEITLHVVPRKYFLKKILEILNHSLQNNLWGANGSIFYVEFTCLQKIVSCGLSMCWNTSVSINQSL